MDYSHVNFFVRSILAVALGLIAFSLYMAYSNRSKLIDGEITKGKAVEYVVSDSSDNDAQSETSDTGNLIRYPKIEFTAADGDTYTFVENNFSVMAKQQKGFDVIYNPEDPTEAMVYSGIDIYGLPVITFMTGLGCLAFGFTAYRINRKKSNLGDRIG